MSNRYPFEFKGSGGEFFKIWIVNVLLTIATLGIYSAWAKVRTTRYFYGNTVLNDASFEYLASPIAILKGRLIAVGLFMLYSILSGLHPLIGSILLLIFFLATPYIVVRALRFHHRMTAYKNIRFDYSGRIGESVMVNLVWPLLSILTLGLLYPFSYQRFVKFYVSNTRYGRSTFDSMAMVGQFYKLFLVMFIVGLVVSAGSGFAAYSLGVFPTGMDNDPEQMREHILPMLAFIYGVSILLYLMMFAFFKSKITNLIMNTMVVDDHVRFESTLSLRRITWILLSNLLAILASLGLAYPWTKVRLAKYRAENTELRSSRSLDEFVGEQVGRSNAVGEEIGEIFDIGIAIS